jgi:hypothetical protein
MTVEEANALGRHYYLKVGHGPWVKLLSAPTITRIGTHRFNMSCAVGEDGREVILADGQPWRLKPCVGERTQEQLDDDNYHNGLFSQFPYPAETLQ